MKKIPVVETECAVVARRQWAADPYFGDEGGPSRRSDIKLAGNRMDRDELKHGLVKEEFSYD